VALFTSEVVKIYRGKFEANFATAGVQCTENKQNPNKHYDKLSINSLRSDVGKYFLKKKSLGLKLETMMNNFRLLKSSTFSEATSVTLRMVSHFRKRLGLRFETAVR